MSSFYEVSLNILQKEHLLTFTSALILKVCSLDPQHLGMCEVCGPGPQSTSTE